MLRALNEYKFQIMALVVLGAGYAASRGGGAALMPLVKVLVPVIVVVLILKMLKKKLSATIGEAFKKQMEAAMAAGGAGAPGANAKPVGGTRPPVGTSGPGKKRRGKVDVLDV